MNLEEGIDLNLTNNVTEIELTAFHYSVNLNCCSESMPLFITTCNHKTPSKLTTLVIVPASYANWFPSHISIFTANFHFLLSFALLKINICTFVCPNDISHVPRFLAKLSNSTLIAKDMIKCSTTCPC